jgi:hypothetical protein
VKEGMNESCEKHAVLKLKLCCSSSDVMSLKEENVAQS